MSPGAWRATLGFGALCLIAPHAGGVTLGRIEVRTPPGAPLEARIAVATGADESLSGACFSLLPRSATPLRDASLELRRSAHGASLFVRTRAPVDEGAAFGVSITCPGAAPAAPVEYTVRFAAAPSLAMAPSKAPARKLPIVTRLAVRPGDTLASLAHSIFPRDDAVRARYLDAMRAENDSLSAVGDDDALPAGTRVALPDLHAFAETVPSAAAARDVHQPQRTAAAASARLEPRPTLKLATPGPAPRRSTKPSLAESKSAERTPSARGGFQLRLSAPVMDLAPSRGMDERKRAELRERLLMLEADDRMAAMLAMRENIRRLESQVSELKLRLAAMPTSAARGVAPEPAQAPTAPIEPPKVQSQNTEAPKLEAPKLEAPKLEAPKVEAPKVEAPKVEAPKIEAPKVEAPGVTAAPTAAERGEDAKPSRPPAIIPRASPEEPWYSDVSWWLRLLLIPLALVLGMRYLARRGGGKRRASEYEEPFAPDVATTEPGAEEVVPDTGPGEETPLGEIALPVATAVPAEDNAELRRRYMEERFPEIVNGALVLEDPASVVKSARLLYDDGAFARAIELLQFAIEQDPDAIAPWLALFAIFRLQGLPGEFAQLAQRFNERHGTSDEWRDVRAIGRSMDPANPLYEGVEFGAPADGEAEGWLRKPADAPRKGLASELRTRLMADASVTDADLEADPMPALRKAEIFSVA